MQVTNFVRNPKTLIIQLSRFEYEKKLRRSVKKHDSIMIPDKIDLPCGTTYSLLSIINHIGETPNSGHYTCLLPEASEDFIEVDDMQVRRPVKQTKQITRTAYILSYSKIEKKE